MVGGRFGAGGLGLSVGPKYVSTVACYWSRCGPGVHVVGLAVLLLRHRLRHQEAAVMIWRLRQRQTPATGGAYTTTRCEPRTFVSGKKNAAGDDAQITACWGCAMSRWYERTCRVIVGAVVAAGVTKPVGVFFFGHHPPPTASHGLASVVCQGLRSRLALRFFFVRVAAMAPVRWGGVRRHLRSWSLRSWPLRSWCNLAGGSSFTYFVRVSFLSCSTYNSDLPPSQQRKTARKTTTLKCIAV